jgi:cbb3-type cytochrome oxidase subunit 1
MEDRSLDALEGALRDSDAEWTEEQRNPELLRARLRREFLQAAVVPFVLALALLAVAPLVGAIVLASPWFSGTLLGFGLLVWFDVLVLVLAIVALLYGVSAWRAYREYRGQLATVDAAVALRHKGPEHPGGPP